MAGAVLGEVAFSVGALVEIAATDTGVLVAIGEGLSAVAASTLAVETDEIVAIVAIAPVAASVERVMDEATVAIDIGAAVVCVPVLGFSATAVDSAVWGPAVNCELTVAVIVGVDVTNIWLLRVSVKTTPATRANASALRAASATNSSVPKLRRRIG